MEEKARDAVESFCRWVEAAGFDNPEYDGLFRSMKDLAESLDMVDRWSEMLDS